MYEDNHGPGCDLGPPSCEGVDIEDGRFVFYDLAIDFQSGRTC